MNEPTPVYNTYAASIAPIGQLKTNKSLVKFILLSLITFGIYGIVVMSSVSNDINVIASRYDGKKTMHYCLLLFLVGPVTLGIADLVWNHRLCQSSRRRADPPRHQLQHQRLHLLAVGHPRLSDRCRPVCLSAQAAQGNESAL